MSDKNDFVIENGVLKKYSGTEVNVVIPDGVTEIGESAFEGKNKIETVIVPEGVRVIGKKAFCKCTCLQSISLPQTLELVEEGAFDTCRYLRYLEFPKNTQFTWMDNVTTNCWYMDCLIYPEGAHFKPFFGDPFSLNGCNNLTSLVCPSIKLEEIAPKQRAVAVHGYIKYTERFHQSDVVESYNAYLFKQGKKLLPDVWECDSVAILQILSDNGKITKKNIDTEYLQPAMDAKATECVKYLMDWKNQNVSAAENERMQDQALKTELEKDPYNIADMKKLWSFKKSEDGMREITSYKGDATAVEIPPRIGKTPVTSIGDEVFKGFSNLTNVTIPESVTSIGDSAFSGCSSLTSITLPEGVTSINYEVFSGCKSLKALTIPAGVTRIFGKAFYECTSLKSMVIPEGVTRIGNNAFSGCCNLKNLTIPASVREIGWAGWSVFDGCDGLTIHTPADSFAEQYARQNKIEVVTM